MKYLTSSFNIHWPEAEIEETGMEKKKETRGSWSRTKAETDVRRKKEEFLRTSEKCQEMKRKEQSRVRMEQEDRGRQTDRRG